MIMVCGLCGPLGWFISELSPDAGGTDKKMLTTKDMKMNTLIGQQ